MARKKATTSAPAKQPYDVVPGGKMTPMDYVELSLHDPSFGDTRRDKLAIAALKFTGQDGVIRKDRVGKRGVKEQRDDAARDIVSNGRFAMRQMPGAVNGSAVDDEDA